MLTVKRKLKTKDITSCKDNYLSNTLLILGLIGVLIISIIFAVSIGSVKIPFGDVYEIILSKVIGSTEVSSSISAAFIDIVWQIRLPRVLLGVVAGVGLALGGSVMQVTVQNPLADPYILGISSGATLGATFAMLFSSVILGNAFGSLGVSFWGFLGATLATFMVFSLSSIGGNGRITPVKLVLSGMVVNLICSAFSNLMIYFTNDNAAIRSAAEWTMGSLTGAKWENIALPALLICVIGLFFISQCRIMDTMLLGDEAAITLGVDLNKYRRVYLVLASILTGVLVAACGIIGFIGLIIPHITRGLVGSNHKKNLPVVMLFGGIFLIWADVLARVILKNMEMPIGIITSVVGTPFFAYIMIKRSYSFGER